MIEKIKELLGMNTGEVSFSTSARERLRAIKHKEEADANIRAELEAAAAQEQAEEDEKILSARRDELVEHMKTVAARYMRLNYDEIPGLQNRIFAKIEAMSEEFQALLAEDEKVKTELNSLLARWYAAGGGWNDWADIRNSVQKQTGIVETSPARANFNDMLNFHTQLGHGLFDVMRRPNSPLQMLMQRSIEAVWEGVRDRPPAAAPAAKGRGVQSTEDNFWTE